MCLVRLETSSDWAVVQSLIQRAERGKLQLKSGGHCGRKSKEANPLQRLRAREQTHCTKKQKYPQGCSAVRAARDGPELSRVANRLVNLAGVPGR